MTEFDFPTQYEPYGTLRIGTNILENVKALASVGSNVPLLIGKGSTPRVWLSIPADRSGTSWYPLIKDNFSSHPEVRVEAHRKTIVIRTPQGTVLSAIQGRENALSVQRLDLRPFGLNIYADEGSLHVMGNTLTKNEFRNMSVVIGIGTSR
jgi:hypothetical protein